MSKIKPEHLFYLPLLSVFTLVFVDMNNHRLLPYIYLLSIFSYWIAKRKIEFNKNQSVIAMIAILITFIAIRQFHYFSSSSIRIAVVSLFLLATFPKNILNRQSVSVLIFISSIVALSYTIYQYYFLGLQRGWSVNPIIHSTFTVSLLCISFYFSLTTKGWLSKLNLLSCLFLSYCINLSETRSAILSYTVCASYISFYLIRNHHSKKTKTTLLFLGLITIMLLNGRLLDRLYDVIAPLSSKFSHTVNTNTEDQDLSVPEKKEFKFSAGYRLEAWAAGKEVIMKTFPIGSGDDTRHYLSQYLNPESSLLSKMTFHHFHNQYIDSIAKHGLLGLISIAILFGFPAMVWIRNKNESSLLFFITAVVFFVAGLTDVPLNNKPTLIFYLTMFVVYAYYNSDQEKEE